MSRAAACRETAGCLLGGGTKSWENCRGMYCQFDRRIAWLRRRLPAVVLELSGDWKLNASLFPSSDRNVQYKTIISAAEGEGDIQTKTNTIFNKTKKVGINRATVVLSLTGIKKFRITI